MEPMMKTWTLVANGTRARLYSSEAPHAELAVVREFPGDGSGDGFTSGLFEFLNLSRQDGRFECLAVAAPTEFIDEFRLRAGDDLNKCVRRIVEEDLSNETPRDLARRIHAVLWVVVADRARARILAQEDSVSRRLREMKDLAWPEAHLKPSEALSDRPGRFSSVGGQRELLEPHTDYRHKTAEDFAALVVDHLDDARSTQGLLRLMLVSPPLFLGELRKKLTPPLRKTIEREIDRDWTQLSLSDIEQRVFETQH